MINRRTFLQSSAAVAAFAASAGSARADSAPGVTDTEIKIGQTMPYSGPASAYGVIGRTEARLFQDDQRAGRRERPQDQPDQPRRRLQPAEDGRAGAPAGRAGAGRLSVPDARHRVESARSGQYLQRQQDAAALRRHRRRACSPIRSTSPGRWASNPNYQTEARIYGKHILTTKPDGEDRACSIRTTTSARTT